MIGPGYLDAVGVPLDDGLGKSDVQEYLDDQTVFRAEMRIAFLTGQRSTLAPVSILDPIWAEGSAIGTTLRRDALWSRYTAGAREADRDRRRFR